MDLYYQGVWIYLNSFLYYKCYFSLPYDLKDLYIDLQDLYIF